MISRRSALKGMTAAAAAAVVATPLGTERTSVGAEGGPQLEAQGTWQAGMFKVAGSSFDRFTGNPGLGGQQWIADHFQRMLVYNPYFEHRTTWYPRGLAYVNA